MRTASAAGAWLLAVGSGVAGMGLLLAGEIDSGTAFSFAGLTLLVVAGVLAGSAARRPTDRGARRMRVAGLLLVALAVVAAADFLLSSSPFPLRWLPIGVFSTPLAVIAEFVVGPALLVASRWRPP